MLKGGDGLRQVRMGFGLCGEVSRLKIVDCGFCVQSIQVSCLEVRFVGRRKEASYELHSSVDLHGGLDAQELFDRSISDGCQ